MENIILPKIAKLGIYDAEIVYSHISTTPKRRVSMFEIELPIENGGILHIDDKDYPIRTDMVICAKPGSTRNTTLPFKCYYLHLDAEGSLASCLSEVPGVFKTDMSEMYVALFKDIILKYNSAELYSNIMVGSKVLELLHRMLIEGSRYANSELSKNVQCNPIIREALRYIDANFVTKSTLEELSKQVNLSPIYFHKLFKTAVGETPYQYVLKKRLKKAIEMLITGHSSFTDIAFDCGFSSQSYFNHVFKKAFGKTPGEYRSMVYNNYPSEK